MIKKLSFIPVFVICLFAVKASAQTADLSPSSNGSDLDQRVVNRIQKLKPDLNEAQIRALKARCKAAQTRISAVRKNAENYSTAQNQRLDKIADNLTKLTENLKMQGVNTSRVDQQVETVNSLKKQIDTAYNSYILALEDAVKLDCESLPEGFRSTIDDAKKQFSELQKLRQTLRKTINPGLKDALVELKDSL